MNILLVGYGNMGKIIYTLAKNEIIKIIDKWTDEIEDDIKIDIIIDFSNHENIKSIYKYAKSTKCKVLIGTTNLNNEDYNLLTDLSNYTAVMVDSNYSKGITVLKEILDNNIHLLKEYDIELLEIHHRYKKDIPSGTMKNIEEIFKQRDVKYNVHCVRAGSIRGEHQVNFYGEDEYIELKHVALSRKIFATGALEAAKWLQNQEKGLFSFKDFIFSKKK